MWEKKRKKKIETNWGKVWNWVLSLFFRVKTSCIWYLSKYCFKTLSSLLDFDRIFFEQQIWLWFLFLKILEYLKFQLFSSFSHVRSLSFVFLKNDCSSLVFSDKKKRERVKQFESERKKCTNLMWTNQVSGIYVRITLFFCLQNFYWQCYFSINLK